VLRALLAAVALLALVVGAPALLLATVGNPIPDRWSLSTPLTNTALLGVLACVGIGGLCGALTLAAAGDRFPRHVVLSGASYVFSALLIVFALISFWALREFITLTPTRRGDHRGRMGPAP